MKKILIGESDFKKIQKEKAYYIDKSLFIEDMLNCPHKVMLLPRPRRFGKTLNLSLLYHFFEKRDEDESYLFDNLAIKKSPLFQDYFGKYPVIFITFKDIKHVTWEACWNDIKHIISQVYETHSYLLNSDYLSEQESLDYKNIIKKEANEVDYSNSLKMLSKHLNDYHQKDVIILTDEYDTPIHAGYQYGYYDEYAIPFMRNLLSGAYKDNSNLYRGVITGTLRISKESIFTGLNNLGVYTLLKKKFNTSFGFTEDEVKNILEDFNLSEHYPIILKWYDGYKFGGKKVFNPWSVMNFISNNDEKPEPYWINTSSLEMIEEIITPNKQNLREELNDLIEGKVITKTIHENMVFDDIKDSRSDLLWSFLLHSGYLKVVEEVETEYRRKFQLQIPNHEVEIIYMELVEKWLKKHIDLKQLKSLLWSLKNGEITLFEKNLKAICLEIMSYHDFSGSPEKVYHALVLGMLVWLSNDYVIRSNRESGYGRYDIIFKPKDITKQGIIIEFKRIYEDEDSEEVLDGALKQID